MVSPPQVFYDFSLSNWFLRIDKKVSFLEFASSTRALKSIMYAFWITHDVLFLSV